MSFFTSEPKLLDEQLTGGKPVHVVGNAEAVVTAVYFDESGTAQVVDGEALAEGEFHALVLVVVVTVAAGCVAGCWLAGA